MNVVNDSQKFRVRVWKSYRTHRSSGYFYGSLTELTEVPGRYTNVAPVPRVLRHGRTELAEVSGTGMNVVHNSQSPGSSG